MVDGELDPVEQGVGTGHPEQPDGWAGRERRDEVGEVAGAVAVLHLLDVPCSHRQSTRHHAGHQVGAGLAGDQVRHQIVGVPPCAQGGRVGTEGEQGLDDRATFGLGEAGRYLVGASAGVGLAAR